MCNLASFFQRIKNDKERLPRVIRIGWLPLSHERSWTMKTLLAVYQQMGKSWRKQENNWISSSDKHAIQKDNSLSLNWNEWMKYPHICHYKKQWDYRLIIWMKWERLFGKSVSNFKWPTTSRVFPFFWLFS